MSLLLIGFSHRTAPVTIRERYAVEVSELAGMNEKLVQIPEIEEAALISTCNRTELLAVSSEPTLALDRLYGFFRSELGDGSAGQSHFYELHEGDAVLHLLRVAASLDSMVLGEAQILGQLKLGYRAALAAHSVGPILNRLFQRAFSAAKRVRTQTGLGSAMVSVARVGVHLARQLFESLERKNVLLLGAGEMAESALGGLREAGVEKIVVLSRTHEAAQRVAARWSGRPGCLEELDQALRAADLVLCSLQVRDPILRRDQLERVMEAGTGRPLLIVDLGIPRNVAAEVNEIENVYLYDLDDLEDVAEQGRADRRAEILPAERFLLHERDRFEAWRESLPVVPTIRELLALANELASAEARRAGTQLADSGVVTQEALEGIARGIVAKLLHRPLQQLREESKNGSSLYYAEAVRRLFGLDVEEDEDWD